VAAPGGPAVQTTTSRTVAHADWVVVPYRANGIPTTASTTLLSLATFSIGGSPHKVSTSLPL